MARQWKKSFTIKTEPPQYCTTVIKYAVTNLKFFILSIISETILMSLKLGTTTMIKN